ncbi:MBL fold metallo-hydrolase [Tumebacillus sp. DT12]|uniref:MBL fold metallo-hydrolase n=1 Tax=Tumebacillus lacus TaxID=2995335 RepID=A0ABT3X201_9BACL|nr:MBL fold metallo-hydrolase [Tumebacillus lacus]MCX7570913.1 MBL fold metallo-hydrolase [Tumebacillus lacus]
MAVQTVNSEELHHWLEQGEPLVLLDVRSPQEIAEWKIQTEPGLLVNIPYAAFEQGDASAWQDLPKGKKIAVICRRGRTAKLAADVLAEHGDYDLYVLERGMQGWSQFYHPVTVHADDSYTLIQMMRLGKGCLSYMIHSGGEAVVVDPGRHVEEYVRLAEREGVRIKHILDTHLHADHISGASELAAQTGATYYLSAQEMQEGVIRYEDVSRYERISLSGVDLQVLLMQTPGHTPGSVSFLVNDRWLLSGDTIFVSGLGRPDLGGKAQEWALKLYETVLGQIAPLSDDVVVLPAHFSEISERCADGYVGAALGRIRADNAVMRLTDAAAFAAEVTARIGTTPPNYAEIVQINRGLVTADDDKRLELEVGPNRCAVKHLPQ